MKRTAHRINGVVPDALAVHLRFRAALLKLPPGRHQVIPDLVVAALDINGHNPADVLLNFQQSPQVAFLDFLPPPPNLLPAPFCRHSVSLHVILRQPFFAFENIQLNRRELVSSLGYTRRIDYLQTLELLHSSAT